MKNGELFQNRRGVKALLATLKKKVDLMWDSVVEPQHLIAGERIPSMMILDRCSSGVFLGMADTKSTGEQVLQGEYVGIPEGIEGNYLLVGQVGSGKSYFIIMSVLETWKSPIVALDIKGEISGTYAKLRQSGRAKRRYIKFAPGTGGFHYDPFALLRQSDESHLAQYITEIAFAIIPSEDITQAYWIDSARNYLAAGLAYFFLEGDSFIAAVVITRRMPIQEFCQMIRESDYQLAKDFLGVFDSQDIKIKADIKSDVDRFTAVFVTDADMQEALYCTGRTESFSWEDIVMFEDAPHVFLCLKQELLEQWSGIIRLMITQLIHQLERRPDKHMEGGKEMNHVLVMLDEFPQLGRMDIIERGLATLRSKKVSFFLAIQDLAQLDLHYGKELRRCIISHCTYKIFLKFTEPESQEYFSQIIGEERFLKLGVSRNCGERFRDDNVALQIHEEWDFSIRPYEFARNDDIIVHTPFGLFKAMKLPYEKKFL